MPEEYIKVYSQLTPQEERQLHYKRLYKKINPKWDDSLIVLTKLFTPYLKPKMEVLDAGCGNGNYVIDEYRKQIKKAVGIDISKESVKKNICLDEIVIGNLEKMPFKNNSFDAVLSLWVIEHLKNPAKVFSEVFRVLKPGGTFFFVTPYKYSYILIGKNIFGKTLNKLFLSKLYGRREEDTFSTEYNCNSPDEVNNILTQIGFLKNKLFLNPDPSYIAFNNIFFKIGVFLEKIEKIIPFNLTKMHIIGVYIKPSN